MKVTIDCVTTAVAYDMFSLAAAILYELAGLQFPALTF